MVNPVVLWRAPDDPTVPLVVLLHGRGSDERDIITLADHLPPGLSYAAVRAPIPEGSGFAWFANQGIGRPQASSIAETISWFRAWLQEVAPPERAVILVGFSGGATFGGGLVLDDPDRFAGLATMYATLPFDAGIPAEPGQLRDLPVLVVQGETDQVIPPDLQLRTWLYLHQDSGARVSGLRTPGGHAITLDDVKAVNSWISGVLDAR